MYNIQFINYGLIFLNFNNIKIIYYAIHVQVCTTIYTQHEYICHVLQHKTVLQMCLILYVICTCVHMYHVCCIKNKTLFKLTGRIFPSNMLPTKMLDPPLSFQNRRQKRMDRRTISKQRCCV